MGRLNPKEFKNSIFASIRRNNEFVYPIIGAAIPFTVAVFGFLNGDLDTPLKQQVFILLMGSLTLLAGATGHKFATEQNSGWINGKPDHTWK